MADAPATHRPEPTRPVLPDYDGACIAGVVPALLSTLATGTGPDWLPEGVAGAHQIALLVLDGLGWHQLRDRAGLAPTLGGARGADRPATSVAPTTTACALTSLTTGAPPAAHGLLGYRLAAGSEILNLLRWTVGPGEGRDARRTLPASRFQPLPPFPGAPRPVPVVSKTEFGGTGFTAAHLARSPLHGYHVPSSLPVEVGRLLASGEPFVYAYYDGMDRVAHADGFGDCYDAELRAVDHLVAELAARLPPGAVLVVTADHGQVAVGPRIEVLGSDLMSAVTLLSGEGRFRWLHARPGAAPELAAGAAERYRDRAWVLERDRVVDDGWFGGRPAPAFLDRLGDVALVPWESFAFLDPADTGESRLQCRHGSLTADEMLVPLLALGGA